MENNYITLTDKSLAQFAKVLSHPARIAILRTMLSNSIRKNNSCCGDCNCEGCECKKGGKCNCEGCSCGCRCQDFVNQLPLAQSTVSQHIKELRSAGIVENSSKKGEYRVNYNRLSEGIVILLGLLYNTEIASAQEAPRGGGCCGGGCCGGRE